MLNLAIGSGNLQVWLHGPLLRGLPDAPSSIFVRDSYLTMFDTVWAQAILSEGHDGLIIIGQPGIDEGKTLFIFYLLVRLLQRKQVVLFSPDGKKVYLFYFGKVYTAFASDVGGKLPNPKSSSDVFIWSLFDI